MEENRKEKRNFYSGIVIIILLFIAIVVSYIKNNSSENHTNQKSNIDSISENDTTIWIEETYKVEMGNHVTYVFSNPSGEGVLTVEGKGAIKDFGNLEDFQQYLIEELYKQYKKKQPTTQVEQNDFLDIINNVKKIEIEEGITKIGKGAFSTFFYVESVTIPTTVEQIEEVAFLGTGQYAKETKWIGLDLSEIHYEENSFLATNGIVISEEGEYFINTIDIDTNTEKEDNYNLKELELLEVIKMGEDIEYQLYNNGLLVVSGSGATYSFHSEADLYKHFKEHIYCMTRNEVCERWFNQIKYVLIDTDVTEIGDYALSNIWYVEKIVVMPKLTKVGKNAFEGIGSYLKQETVWNVDFSETQVDETTLDK